MTAQTTDEQQLKVEAQHSELVKEAMLEAEPTTAFNMKAQKERMKQRSIKKRQTPGF